MANILLFTLGRALDANGNTAAGAKAYIYEAGTTTPMTAYQDNAATTQHANPVVADAGGLFAAVYITEESAKVVITKSDDTVLQTLDPCPVISVGGVGASGISFSPTVDIPETNVQDAIETAAATAASGFAPFGLGVTGNAPDLANIDATNIGTGFYRTTASTTGTFPTGITASSTSVVRMERETSALGVMTLMDDSGNVFQRYMIASAWGAWRHIVTMPVSPTTGDIVQWNGTAWAGITAGALGTILRGGGAGVVSSFQSARVYSTAYTTTGGTTADSTGLFPGGANIPSWATKVGIELLGVSCAGATSTNMVRIGDSSSFLSTNYVSHSSYDGTSDYNDTTGFAVWSENAGGSSVGRIVLHKMGTGDWTASHTVSLSSRDATAAGGGYILSANLGGKTIDRVRYLCTGTTFDAMRIIFWYE